MGDYDPRSILARAHAEVAAGRPNAALQSVVEAVSAAGFHPSQFPSLMHATQLSQAASPHMNDLAHTLSQVGVQCDQQPRQQQQQKQHLGSAMDEDMMQVVIMSAACIAQTAAWASLLHMCLGRASNTGHSVLLAG